MLGVILVIKTFSLNITHELFFLIERKCVYSDVGYKLGYVI